jgi:hypothetical protein
MIAAIYARKSTEQTGVADEQRSVAAWLARSNTRASMPGAKAGRSPMNTSTSMME